MLKEVKDLTLNKRRPKVMRSDLKCRKEHLGEEETGKEES